MFRRQIEVCPACGQWEPWRKVTTHIVRGQKRVYVECFRCGFRDVAVYVPPPAQKPIDGLLPPNK